MALRLMRKRTLAQRRCSQSLCFIRPRRGDSNFFLDPWHSKAPTAITLPVAPSCVITPMAISNPAGMSLASGPSVELASAQGLSLNFSRSGRWLTENVGQLCPPIQPLHTHRVIKPPVPLTGTNPEPRPGTRTALDAHCDAMDGRTQTDLLDPCRKHADMFPIGIEETVTVYQEQT